MADTFPRQYARTQRFTLGEPRTFTVSPDGQRVVFLRSAAGDDPVTCLWVLSVEDGAERLVVDPRDLLGGAVTDELPPDERAKRERLRESAQGITAYACDAQVRVCAFALAGRLFTAGLLSGGVRELAVAGPVFDPRPDPTARRIAYVRDRSLVVTDLRGRTTVLAGNEPLEVSWGLAEFIAAEEMGRVRGFWWSPDGERIAATRVDTTRVARWHIADPAEPWQPPTLLHYPAAGAANAEVSLHLLDLEGAHQTVAWDLTAFPYLTGVTWDDHGLLLSVQSRDQRQVQLLDTDLASGATTVIAEDHDDVWVELVAGVPGRLNDGRVITCADRDGARRLLVAGEEVTPAVLQVRAVLHIGQDDVLFSANDLDDPLQQHLWRWSAAGLVSLSSGPGVHTGAGGGPTVVVHSRSLDYDGASTAVLDGPTIESRAETPHLSVNVTLQRVAERALATALVLPHDVESMTGPLPVLLDPYGGPHANRVVSSRHAYLSSQWFADQGFAVVIVDGRGTPGRGSGWERSVHRDLAGPVLDDQVDALFALAAHDPRLDLSKVAIRGWSFGGYLAALAVLRRPDVFHAAIAGAPVTEWRLYDTHYSERYLGDPNTDPAPYDATSLVLQAGRLERPLLLIHGLADDNVVAAHTLQLSAALLATGKSHQVLLLAGVTHMTPQEVVAENLLLAQLAFLRGALDLSGLAPGQPAG